MKQENCIEKKAKSQIQQSIQNACVVANVRMNQNFSGTTMCNEDFNILLNQNMGKAPPGRKQYWSLGRGHPPENRGDPQKPENQNYIDFKYINTNTNYYKHLNFIIMKKQILFLVFVLLAAFSSVNKSYAQCADDALHPMAGKLYHYKVTTTGGGTAKSYQWAVTTSPNIVAAGTFVTTIAPGASTFAWSGETTDDVSITWSPTVIAAAMASTPTAYYVAVKYVATNSEGCDVDNVKVYKIDPVNLFQIDLANVKVDGSALASGNVCTSTVVTATITPATLPATPTITYDYGLNSMYVKVNAQYFSASWDMLVDASLLTNLGAAETSKLFWSTTIGGAETAVTPGTAITIPETTADPTDVETIFLRFEVDHNTFEGLADQGFTFRVDGKDKAGNDDVSATCTADADAVTQTILARPTINNATTVGTYIMP